MVFKRGLWFLNHEEFILLFSGLVLATSMPLSKSLNQSHLEEASVTFTLFATDMSGCDSTSACDLYVKISCASLNSDWQACGETSKRQDDDYPVWPEVFNFNHISGTSQRWKFELLDVDVAFDDLISTIEVDMDEYAKAPGNLYQVPVPGNTGVLWIHRQR